MLIGVHGLPSYTASYGEISRCLGLVCILRKLHAGSFTSSPHAHTYNAALLPALTRTLRSTVSVLDETVDDRRCVPID